MSILLIAFGMLMNSWTAYPQEAMAKGTKAIMMNIQMLTQKRTYSYDFSSVKKMICTAGMTLVT